MKPTSEKTEKIKSYLRKVYGIEHWEWDSMIEGFTSSLHGASPIQLKRKISTWVCKGREGHRSTGSFPEVVIRNLWKEVRGFDEDKSVNTVSGLNRELRKQNLQKALQEAIPICNSKKKKKEYLNELIDLRQGRDE